VLQFQDMARQRRRRFLDPFLFLIPAAHAAFPVGQYAEGGKRSEAEWFAQRF